MNTHVFRRALIVLFAWMVIKSNYGLAAPGDLDPAFGVGGKAITPFGTADARAMSVVSLSGGKLIVAGYVGVDGRNHFALARYLSDGTLDTTFGAEGRVTSAISIYGEFGRSVAAQKDGKILVAGELARSGAYDFALARYLADGSLDGTFGTNGVTTTSIGGNDFARSVLVQSDGKIVVAGEVHLNGVDFGLVRYNADGMLDSTFGSGGIVLTDFAKSFDYAQAAALQGDGKILVTGWVPGASGYDMALVRYRTDGTLDDSFGSGGKVSTAVGSYHDFSRSATVQSDGKIVVAGDTSAGDFALVRYLPDGSLDSSFGSAGKVTVSIGNYESFGRSLTAQSDGKIVVAGYSGNGRNYDFALARFNADGALDPTFGTGGKVVTPIGPDDDYGMSVALQEDGGIVVAGSSSNGTNNDFALVRYVGSGTTAPEMDVRTMRISVASGDTTPSTRDGTDFGSTGVGTPVIRTFRVYNTGSAPLTLGSITAPNGFAMDRHSSSIAPGSSASLTVRLLATGPGAYSGEVSIPNNDADENPYRFRIAGTVLSPQPDLAVSSIAFSPSQPLSGQSFTATVTVTNRGAVASDAGWLDVWVNSSASQPCGASGTKWAAVGPLGAAASKTITFPSLTAPSSGFPWTFRALIDSTCAVAESLENNNQMTISYGAAAPQPDFVVTSIVFNPPTPHCGQPFTASVTVKNQGTGAADGGYLDVWVNRATAQTCGALADKYQSVGSIAAGAIKTFTFAGLNAPASGAPWVFRAFVDSYCATTESNEANNQTTASYGDCPQPPDFVISTITFSPSAPDCGQPFTANITVKNQGPDPGDGGSVDVWINQAGVQACGSKGDSHQSVGWLAAGQSKTLTFAGLNAPPTGTPLPWTFRAFIDSGCLSKESAEANNQQVKSYGQCLPKPDFVVLSGGISPSDVRPGQAFSAYVIVGNLGTVPGNCGWVDAWEDRSTPAHCGEMGQASQQVGYLGVGETRLLTFTGLTAGPAGPRNMLVYADSECSTPELNENNNQASFAYFPAVEVWNFLVMPDFTYHLTPAQWTSIKTNFLRGSNFQYDATDGQVRFGRITCKDPNWLNPFEAWELPLANFRLRPQVRSQAVPFGLVMLGYEAVCDHSYATIVHELGHYKFAVLDEYTDAVEMIFGGADRTRYCRSKDHSGSIMDRQYEPTCHWDGTSEYCTPSGPNSQHDPRDLNTDAPSKTVQDLVYGSSGRFASAWERIHNYNGAIAIPAGDPLPGPCSKSSDPTSALSHEPMEPNDGAARYSIVKVPGEP